ncbi:MAG: hypothetical protein LQ341_001675 [Variospora aurantia]|nr:MAG: hypothetical protein LQ341_001675 [Variospora aurantia]
MPSQREHLVSHQPWKALYALCAALLTSIRLPFYLMKYSVPSFRPHQKWTYQQALMNRLFRSFLYHAAIVEVRTPIAPSPNVANGRTVVMGPAPAETFVGVARDAVIEPSAVEGTCYPTHFDATGDDQESSIILHFHGGGYAMCKGSDEDSAFAANLLVKHVAAKALFPSYRLSSNHGGRFPAALQDAITSYQYLLELGIPPGKIIVSGDSAGGNLALALLRYMAENPQLLPPPSSVLLWSPTTDMLAAKEPLKIDQNRNSSTDFLAGHFCAWGARGLTTDAPSAATPYFAPRSHPFSSQVPIWIQLGGLEVLYDDAFEFAENMRGQGNSVVVYVEPYANHDIFYLGGNTGFAEEAVKAAKAASAFLKGRLHN